MIINIRVDKLFPHPDNPRENIGDLSELAESIKANGILQNLTVVPWNSNVPEWDEEEQRYTVVIGHRRLAAAKIAGLERVPCAIVEMDKKAQVATMLLENIQRNDLTIYEQAQGFQMMLDLGETVSDISEKTGFSETTVRRRTKLLELDQDKLKESIERGATIMDYVKLEKIQNIELRNEALEKIGTNNFRWALQNAIERERSEEMMEAIAEQLEPFATEIESETEYDVIFVRAYHDTVENEKVVVPDDADEVNYFFRILNHGSIYLYKEKSDDEINRLQNETEGNATRLALGEAAKQAYKLRREFICNVSNANAKKNIGIIIEHLIYAAIHSYVGINPEDEDIDKLLNIEISEEEEFGFDKIVGDLREQPEKYLLIVTYLSLDNDRENYFRWDCAYCKNEYLDRTYDFLETLGYEISDEELSLRNGTHGLFQKGANND